MEKSADMPEYGKVKSKKGRSSRT